MTDTYTCAKCRGTFEIMRDDKEARAEFEQNFPELSVDKDAERICEDCFNELMGLMSVETPSTIH